MHFSASGRKRAWKPDAACDDLISLERFRSIIGTYVEAKNPVQSNQRRDDLLYIGHVEKRTIFHHYFDTR